MLTLADLENRIICADSLEILPQIPAGLCASIITDPVWPGAKANLPGNENPVSLLVEALRDVHRITNRLILHLGQRTDPRCLAAVPPELLFVQLCWLRWVPCYYCGPVMVGADVAYVFGRTTLPGDGTKVFGGECTSVYDARKTEDARFDPDCNHPTPRSLQHVAWLVQRFSRPGDLILDPFCGSGTTCLAAKLAGRRYCGIDIEPKFVEYARERLSRPDLFS